MKKNFKSKLLISSLISILLIICLVLPFSVFASDDDYVYTATEEELETFANTWQKKFIDNNTVIQNASNNEKKYYILKTLYNFLADNTRYDYDVQKNTNGEFGSGTEQYKNSHSAYGAAFGNKIGEAYNWETYTDSTGLTRIKNYDQGLAVCDGYSKFTELICKKNTIECKRVQGEFKGNTEEEKDAHEWNIIKLYPSDSSEQNEAEANWYYFDATYSATSSKTLKYAQCSFVDYSFLLRGSINKSFTTNHQQLLPEYDGLYSISKNDYKFISNINVDESKTWVILTSRENKEYTYDEQGNIVYTNYLFINPQNEYFKKSEENNELIKSDDSFVYNGNGYYYNLIIQNLVDGVEYNLKGSKEQPYKDAGEYCFYAQAVNSDEKLFTFNFRISPINMGNLDNYTRFKWSDGNTQNDHKTNPSDIKEIEFRGVAITFDVDIIATVNKAENETVSEQLFEGTNYVIKYICDGIETTNAPYKPGEYKLKIDFNQNQNDNYEGEYFVKFRITKGDFSYFESDSVDNIPYALDIISGYSSLKFSNIENESLKKDIDYKVELENPNLINLGDEGYVIFTALNTSEYLKEGKQLKRKYKIVPLDLSELSGNTIAKYTYTGMPITPNDFILQVPLNGKMYYLYNNKDFVILSYRDNVNVGTGYVTVQFIGNFCGQAELGFQIYMPEQNPSNPSGPSNQHSLNNQNSEFVSQSPQVSISVQDNLTYNGTPQTPSAVVTVNGVALISGVDYSVSALPAGAGAYECSIQGLGQYSYINHRAVVFINPAKITGGNTKPSSTSTVTISWNGQGEKCYYEVYTYDAKKKQWVLVAKTKSTSFKTNYYVNNGKKVKVKGNSQYKYRVRAYYSVSVNGKAYTKYGDFTDISGVTKISAPASPKAKKGKNSFKLSWKKVSNASGYEITYATDSKFKKNKKICKVNKGKTTSATIKKLKAGKTYYVKVRAYQNVNGKKVYSGYTKTIKVKVS